MIWLQLAMHRPMLEGSARVGVSLHMAWQQALAMYGGTSIRWHRSTAGSSGCSQSPSCGPCVEEKSAKAQRVVEARGQFSGSIDDEVVRGLVAQILDCGRGFGGIRTALTRSIRFKLRQKGCLEGPAKQTLQARTGSLGFAANTSLGLRC